MQKRIFALLLAAAMVLGLCACGQSVGGSTQDAAASTATEAGSTAAAEAGSTAETAAAGDVLKVGFVYIGDETEAYTANFIAAEKAIADTYGDKVECISKYNVAEDASATALWSRSLLPSIPMYSSARPPALTLRRSLLFPTIITTWARSIRAATLPVSLQA